ncbi:MAG: DUF4198 domain-containing protein [Desulfobacterales bacterium]|nr:DUF4198 domain-containing protein [Desulfobacterales bacterium]
MKSRVMAAVLTTMMVLGCGTALAHFGMVIPSDNMVMQGEAETVNIDLSFSHPFEGIGMDLVKPKSFYAVVGGKRRDLIQELTPRKIMGNPAWKGSFTPKRPGLAAFVMEPQPYWEPAEDCFIIHYTKTYVAAFGDDEGWDEPLGLATEILPLSKPHGLWAGNLFQGQVLVNGKPVPGAEVEVEYYNEGKKISAPSDYMITQTIKADGNGIFSYVAPFPGWWGFAALTTAEEKIKHQGVEKDVEQGAVIWVKFERVQD